MTELAVWEVVERTEATQAGSPLGTRWVECNKGDGDNVVVRSRLVVQETRHQSPDLQPGDVFSATPPVEAMRLVLASAMSRRGREEVVVSFLDISRAHPHCDALRATSTLSCPQRLARPRGTWAIWSNRCMGSETRRKPPRGRYGS